MQPYIKSALIDARNWASVKEDLIEEIANSGLTGLDIETHDHNRHDGLNQFMKVDAEGHKSVGKRLVFDVNRTVVTGFSWFCDGSQTAYYLNLGHADVENRIPWEEARQLLDAKPDDGHWICHNAPFELTMMSKSLGYQLKNVICTLQLAVSAFNDDQYPQERLMAQGFGGMTKLFPAISREFNQVESTLTEGQSELLGKVIGKTSESTFSYNGIVDEVTYGYGLKKLTKSLFNYEQKTFKETLGENAHMGQITGDEVVAYGADDAYWAVQLFHKILPMLPYQNDQLVTTFFEQENPMIHVFSDIWQNGMRVNREAIFKQQGVLRENYVELIRNLQTEIKSRLPFPTEPNEWLAKEKWYKPEYRRRVEAWANLTIPNNPIDAAFTTSGAVPNAWVGRKSAGPNFTHYMMMRTVLYDLTGTKPIFSDGKVASDKEAREKIIKRHSGVEGLVKLINSIATIEQAMKLYITPYLLLCDPDTDRMYPIVSSTTNSRRMAASLPNPMQLAKRGETTYVRGFFLPDTDDELIVSIDWSQIELVLIGDFSDDTGFREAYGQKPFNDLHHKAVADLFGITKEEAKARPDYKLLRTEVGKGANFNYWYSGALSTVGDKMGWSSEKMWDMTEKYRQTFPEAEEWRVNLIGEGRDNGYVTLPDGHRRTKFEATYTWQKWWGQMFGQISDPGLQNFGRLFVKSLTSRAGNQLVNSMIQGSCATLAKRSILRINKMIAETGIRARFMIPIHDELVFSVHKQDVVRFIKLAKDLMCNHPDIVTHLCIDASASVGRTFQPYDKVKAPYGQIEIDECPDLFGLWAKDAKLNDEQIQRVVDYLA